MLSHLFIRTYAKYARVADATDGNGIYHIITKNFSFSFHSWGIFTHKQNYAKNTAFVWGDGRRTEINYEKYIHLWKGDKSFVWIRLVE